MKPKENLRAFASNIKKISANSCNLWQKKSENAENNLRAFASLRATSKKLVLIRVIRG